MSKTSSKILLIIGCIGIIATPILAIIGNNKVETDEDSTEKEAIKRNWKHYIPAAASCAGTLACVIAAKSIDMKQSAKLIASAGLSSAALTKVKREIKQKYGDEALDDIMKSIAEKSKVGKNESEPSNLLSVDSQNVITFFDPYTDIEFKTDRETVLCAILHANRCLQYNNIVPLQEFYHYMGVELGAEFDDVGWIYEVLLGNQGCPFLDISIRDWKSGRCILEYDIDPFPLYDYTWPEE